MNSLKNLMIIAVLAAVGYGVYVSLSRNNIDSDQPFGAPKVDLSGAKASTSRSLPLGPSLTGSVTANNPAPGGLALPAPSQLTPPPLATSATGTPPALSLNVPPLASDPSSKTPPLSPPSFSQAPAGLTANSPGTLGGPASPDGASFAGPAVAPNTGLSVPPAPLLASDNAAAGGAVRNLPPPPEMPTPGGAPPAKSAAARPVDSSLQNTFNNIMDGVRKKLDEGKFADAQLALSILYGSPDLPPDQAKQVTELLDQLAGTVIYSREHYLAPPYVTQGGETIETIAQKYSVPWQLLARINGLMPAGASSTDDSTKDQPLPAGKQLKVLQGPFDAVVQLDKRELTLMVQNRYAARFRIGVGHDLQKLEGEYTVHNKATNPTYYGPDGVNIGPNDPKNPLGGAWIGLTDRIGIHGAADPQSVGRENDRGTICVSDRDLQDLFGILSVGSRVTIVR
jgi:hypothetical protein